MLRNEALEYLDTTLNEAVMAELKNPELSQERLGKVPENRTLIAGLTVISSKATGYSKAVERRRTRLKEFRLDREEATLELIDIGIEPLGIVPIVALEHLFAEGGLIRLAPDRNGRVRIKADTKVHKALLARKNLKPKELCEILFPNGVMPDEKTGRESVRISDGYGGYDYRSYDRTTMIRVGFPEPPLDVQQVLHKARKLELKVAAVPEAILFAEDPVPVVARHLKKIEDAKEQDRKQVEARRRELEEARKRALRYDPIIYTEFGTAAAVIAQFGDFAIEKKIIEAIAHSQYLV